MSSTEDYSGPSDLDSDSSSPSHFYWQPPIRNHALWSPPAEPTVPPSAQSSADEETEAGPDLRELEREMARRAQLEAAQRADEHASRQARADVRRRLPMRQFLRREAERLRLPPPPVLVRNVRRRYLGIDDLLPLTLRRPAPGSSGWSESKEVKRDTAEDYEGIVAALQEFAADLESSPPPEPLRAIRHVRFYLSHVHDGYSFLEQAFIDFTHGLVRYVRDAVLDGRYDALEEAWAANLRLYPWQDICARYWPEAVSEIEKLRH